MLGDSISAAYGIDVDKGWVNLLQNKINSSDLDYQIHNESISGDTSAGGLARINATLKQHQPDLLLLELGANDGLRGLPPVAMKNNLKNIIKQAQDTGVKVLLISMRIPTNYGKRYTELFYNTYSELGNEMNVPVVPFLLKDIALKPELMQQDRLHPNAKAQPLIVERVWPYVLPLLTE